MPDSVKRCPHDGAVCRDRHNEKCDGSDHCSRRQHKLTLAGGPCPGFPGVANPEWWTKEYPVSIDPEVPAYFGNVRTFVPVRHVAGYSVDDLFVLQSKASIRKILVTLIEVLLDKGVIEPKDLRTLGSTIDIVPVEELPK